MPNHAEQLAQELNLNVKNVQGAIELIDQGNTTPVVFNGCYNLGR